MELEERRGGAVVAVVGTLMEGGREVSGPTTFL